MNKRIALVIALLFITTVLTLLFVVTASAATGNTTEFSGGTGTVDDPYLISTKEQLNNVQNHLSAHYKLIADIVFADADYESGGDFYNSAKGWLPIGTSDTTPFKGSFDGAGHTITNLRIKRSSSAAVYGGLFGYNTGVIKNVGLIGGDIYIYTQKVTYVGGIAGYNAGTITNCFSSAPIYGQCGSGNNPYSRVGGIAGYNSGTIENCYNSGTIYGKANSSYNSYLYVGGICGEGSASNCYNVGAIAYSSVGSPAVARVNPIVGITRGATSNNYYLDGCLSGSSAGLTEIQMASKSSYVNFDFSNVWLLDSYYPDEYKYPILKVFATEISSIVINNSNEVAQCLEGEFPNTTAVSITYKDGKTVTSQANSEMFDNLQPHVIGNQRIKLKYLGVESENDVVINVKARNISSLAIKTLPSQAFYLEDYNSYSVSGGVFTVNFADGYTVDFPMDSTQLSKATSATRANQIVLSFRDESIEFTCEKTYAFASGDGSTESPFVIKTTEHLISASNYPSSNFALSNHIEISDADYETDGLLPEGWKPFVFSGVFDGCGHYIINLRVSTVAKTIHTATTVFNCGNPALFSTNNGTIKNLTIEDARYSINAGVYNGGVVCAENNGTIINCHSKNCLVVFNSCNHFGGIVGDNKGTIQNCTSENTLTLDSKAGEIGGIASNNSGNIIGCTNRSVIISAGSDYSTTGGIVATNSGKIIQCRNLASISTTSTYQNRSAYSGGIVGSMSAGEITECYNSGLIYAATNKYSSNAYAGGLVGYLSGGKVSNSYNIGNISASNNAYSGMAYVGGLIGYNKTIDEVANCYSVCQVQGYSSEDVYAGIICGYSSVATIKNCYYIGSANGALGFGDATHIYSVSSEAFSSSATFNNFDFSTVWEIQNDSYAYPQLINNQHVCNHVFSSSYSNDDNYHWNACENKGCTTAKSKTQHIFDHACDTTCVCGYTRTITHEFSGAWQKDESEHWHVCLTPECNATDTKQSHQYSNKCDNSCDCGYTQAITHDFSGTWQKDDTGHWHVCETDGCDMTDTKVAHFYDHACETTCECGYARTISHDFTGDWQKDASGHWHVCADGCGATDTKANHVSAGEASETNPEVCSICGWEISPALGHTTHTPKTEWQKNDTHHWHECTGCDGQEIEKAMHNDGDNNGSCDTCGHTMSVTPPPHTHTYGTTWEINANEHWNECTCGEKTNKEVHIDGDNNSKCDTCNYTMTVNTPEPQPPVNTPSTDDPNAGTDDDFNGNNSDKNDEYNRGLSAGTIAGIAVGSTAVVGIGGFSLIWFVIKKKSWTDFLAIFKK